MSSRLVFRLLRYRHADGSAKEWGWAEHPDGTLEVRWGRADALVQRATYPACKRREVERREGEKLRKGYRAVGDCTLDVHGRPSRVRPPTPPNAPAPRPAPTTKPVVPPLDLTRIGADKDYWF
jgi:hypothetical protein